MARTSERGIPGRPALMHVLLSCMAKARRVPHGRARKTATWPASPPRSAARCRVFGSFASRRRSKMSPLMKALSELVGDSPGIAAIRETVGRLLQRHSETRRLPPILIQGETGTGKGLVARSLHETGPRSGGPFVDVNCAAIPATLLEAEMFGFERGAFTDARHAKRGLFQAAHHGTIFLDEVGLLPEALQSKLLKVIEEREVRRLGSTRSEPVDTWILTATSENLVTAIRERRFREDLYHRLAVLTLWLPPLRERGPDVLRLA